MKSFILTFAMLAMSSMCHSEDPSMPLGAGKPRKHLFPLSGQSNMQRMAKHQDGIFHEAVEKAFGKENVTVVISAEGGKAIRYWDKDYKYFITAPATDKATPGSSCLSSTISMSSWRPTATASNAPSPSGLASRRRTASPTSVKAGMVLPAGIHKVGHGASRNLASTASTFTSWFYPSQRVE